MQRRDFLKSITLTSLAVSTINIENIFAGTAAQGIGMCDWNLGMPCDPEMIPKAAQAGLKGMQVSVGTTPDKMLLRDKTVRDRYIELGKKHNITFHSVAAGGILNQIPLASEPQSAVYVIDAIEAAAAIGSKNILMAFFGNGDLRKTIKKDQVIDLKDGNFSSYELDEKGVTRVVEALRQIVPRAEDAGVVLGLENTLTAKQNLEIIERVGSPMLQVYYDIGNSTAYGYDVPSEIRLLGNDRICEVHIKDWESTVFDQIKGQVNMSAAAAALADINFDKWYCLETSGRKDKFIEDTKNNVKFVKNTFRVI